MVLFLLVFSLLTGSVGVAATQQFCAMLGMSSSTAAAAEMKAMGCCAKQEKPACPAGAASVDKTPCCSSATIFHKLDITTSLKLSKLEFSVAPPMLVHSFLLPPPVLPLVTEKWPFYTDTSPPLAGKDLLHRLHILNI
jgi:hypothetical protein